MAEVVKTSNLKLRARFPARSGYVDRFCLKLRMVMERHGWSQPLFAVELLVREMLNNAVLHGSHANPAMKVRCHIHVKNHSLTITVQDEGPGFNWRHEMVHDWGDQEIHGRGLAILRHYGGNVRYNESGNRIQVTKNLQEMPIRL